MCQPLLYTQLISPNRLQEGRPRGSDAEDVYNTWVLNWMDLETFSQVEEQKKGAQPLRGAADANS